MGFSVIKQPQDHMVKHHKPTAKVFQDRNVLKSLFHLGFFLLSQMHFFPSLAIPTLPPSLEDYGAAQVYQQSLESVYGNSSTTPETI